MSYTSHFCSPGLHFYHLYSPIKIKVCLYGDKLPCPVTYWFVSYSFCISRAVLHWFLISSRINDPGQNPVHSQSPGNSSRELEHLCPWPLGQKSTRVPQQEKHFRNSSVTKGRKHILFSPLRVPLYGLSPGIETEETKMLQRLNKCPHFNKMIDLIV